jgi:predicted DNA-binding ribbon-helix-helix protein
MKEMAKMKNINNRSVNINGMKESINNENQAKWR